MADRATMLLVQLIETSLVRVRKALAALANEAELRLRMYEARHAADRKQWVEDVRQAIADGSIGKEIDAQPDPEEIVDRWPLTMTA